MRFWPIQSMVSNDLLLATELCLFPGFFSQPINIT
jgi:hypothetical protein